MIQMIIGPLRQRGTGSTRSRAVRGLVGLIAWALWLGDWSGSTALAASLAAEFETRRDLLSTCTIPPVDPQQFEPDGQTQQATRPVIVTSRLLLPDLRTLPPYDLEIETLPDGSRELRLSNTIWNSGAGALELEGKLDPATHKTRVEQHVQARAGTKLDYFVGEFVWHPRHDHWHFEDFSLYELWKLTSTGNLDEVVSSSGKVSYCLIDTDVIDRANQGFAPHRHYYGCGQALQGLSAGWGDTYKSFLDGQSIHLAVVEDGIYALKSTANPNAVLLEANYQNNAALFYLEIHSEHVELIAPEEIAERRCLKNGWC